ncbi:hypothetical protein GCM10012289_26690 [Nonomuraea cavernae]|uniref:Uncharacterized protein n=1 Tax=Nonomuraea cavernae TaxID=2045107 RepID=A0A918DIP0_9ACTN|nr:hypothetical protein GCM10012289_26690 [Nonomuraea cavernae]
MKLSPITIITGAGHGPACPAPDPLASDVFAGAAEVGGFSGSAEHPDIAAQIAKMTAAGAIRGCRTKPGMATSMVLGCTT